MKPTNLDYIKNATASLTVAQKATVDQYMIGAMSGYLTSTQLMYVVDQAIRYLARTKDGGAA